MRLLALFVLAALAGAFLLSQPSDADQIGNVTRRTVDAVNRGDSGTAYRLTDLDFRAICPADRYADVLRAEQAANGPRHVEGVSAVRIGGARASAAVTLSGPGGTRHEQWEFVREGSRWYLYEDVGRCGAGVPRIR